MSASEMGKAREEEAEEEAKRGALTPDRYQHTTVRNEKRESESEGKEAEIVANAGGSLKGVTKGTGHGAWRMAMKEEGRKGKSNPSFQGNEEKSDEERAGVCFMFIVRE